MNLLCGAVQDGVNFSLAAWLRFGENPPSEQVVPALVSRERKGGRQGNDRGLFQKTEVAAGRWLWVCYSQVFHNSGKMVADGVGNRCLRVLSA